MRHSILTVTKPAVFALCASWFRLFAMPQSYMEDYGDGILAVLDGGDPYEAFEACQAAVNAQ